MASVSVRYIVDDVDAAIGFYADALGFTLEMHPAPAFAMLSRETCASCCRRPAAGRAAARRCRTGPSRAGRLEPLPAGGGRPRRDAWRR